ncbi:precorrin-3B synthase [Modicisalibacter xianhensis]|uniref:Precorrin-3B synthase n=1 Tax=Modicisalibacter xianhensis TaxID=442341 RepID=A0A4V3GU87_9GAMM|nr:cobalamin biosynthesis protein CobG [Halomonas xianhensis]TDX29508.1 precorrin-3B synthase [Halomonas xianhensis]
MTHEVRIKGWCPGAWRPMATGDGLLVRVRPLLGRLSRAQVLALCDAAETFGSGLIELTSRANLQLRGVSEAGWPKLMAFLVEHRLVTAEPHDERHPPLLLAPEWQVGDATQQAAHRLQARLAEMPPLPAKLGFALDAGDAPVLSEASADFRLERAASGGLLVRADGRARGTPVASVDAAVALLVRLTHWFVDSGGQDAGRMARHAVALPDWAPATVRPAAPGARLALGQHPRGWVFGLPFGRVPAKALRDTVAPATVTAVRVTPWRRLLVEGAEKGDTPPADDLPDDERDTRLRMDACPGAPHCAQASVPTLALAERLSGLIEGTVHVSGCAKGCARQQPATLCLTGRAGRYDLILGGRADDTPAATGLGESDLLAYLETLDASRL